MSVKVKHLTAYGGGELEVKAAEYANHAKEADSATKATQDGNGKTITDTYVTLATAQSISGQKNFNFSSGANDSPVTITSSNIGKSASGLLGITSSGDSEYCFPLTMLYPNLTDGHGIYFGMGKASSSNDKVSLGYYYAGKGSSDNRFAVSFFGQSAANAPLQVFPSKVAAGGATFSGGNVTAGKFISSDSTSDVVKFGTTANNHEFSITGDNGVLYDLRAMNKTNDIFKSAGSTGVLIRDVVKLDTSPVTYDVQYNWANGDAVIAALLTGTNEDGASNTLPTADHLVSFMKNTLDLGDKLTNHSNIPLSGQKGGFGVYAHLTDSNLSYIESKVSPKTVNDSGNNKAISFQYSSGGYGEGSHPQWLAAWNGYKLTYVDKKDAEVGLADEASKVTNAFKIKDWANNERSYDGSSAVTIDVKDLFGNSTDDKLHFVTGQNRHSLTIYGTKDEYNLDNIPSESKTNEVFSDAGGGGVLIRQYVQQNTQPVTYEMEYSWNIGDAVLAAMLNGTNQTNAQSNDLPTAEHIAIFLKNALGGAPSKSNKDKTNADQLNNRNIAVYATSDAGIYASLRTDNLTYIGNNISIKHASSSTYGGVLFSSSNSGSSTSVSAGDYGWDSSIDLKSDNGGIMCIRAGYVTLDSSSGSRSISITFKNPMDSDIYSSNVRVVITEVYFSNVGGSSQTAYWNAVEVNGQPSRTGFSMRVGINEACAFSYIAIGSK